MSVETFRLFVASAAPFGGWLQSCTPEGVPHRRPGSLSAPIERVLVSDSALHPDIYQVRFQQRSSARYLTVLTTDPWTWEPVAQAWLIPTLDETGALDGWLRLVKAGGRT